MKYAFFNTEAAANAAMKDIEDAIGITEGTLGFPKNRIDHYGDVKEVGGRWGFLVSTSGEDKADHLVDTEEYEEPE